MQSAIRKLLKEKANMSDSAYEATSMPGAGGRHRVACLFESRATADLALEDLVSAGVPRNAIEIVDQSHSGVLGATEEGGGLWDSIKRLFGAEDAHGYYEGVGRGHTLVTVSAANDAEAERAAAVLERHEPIDIDAHEAGWRESGWNPSNRADLTSGAADLGMAGAGMTTAGTTTTGTASDIAAGVLPTGGMTSKPPARATATSELEMAGRAADPSLARPTTGDWQGGVQPAGTQTTGDDVIPVVQEDLAVGKRTVARGGVRVRTHVIETPVEEDVRLRDERVQIERRPVDRAAPVGEDAFRERSIEMTEFNGRGRCQQDGACGRGSRHPQGCR